MSKALDIIINMRTNRFKGGLGILTRSLGLVRSAIVATFRTAVVASFFLVIREGVKTFSALKQGITSVITTYSKLHDQARLTAAVMTKGRTGFTAAFEGVKKFAAEASAASRFSMKQISEGLFTTAIAGYKLGDAMKITSLGLQMSTISGMKYQGVMVGLISTTKAFGIETGKMKAMAEVVTGAFTSSLMTLENFFASMKYVAPAAVAAFGESEKTFRNVAAALSVMHDVGLSSSKAGIYSRSAIVKLMAPTPKIMDLFSRYNVNIFEKSGDSSKYVDTMINSMKITGELSKKVAKLKDEQFKMLLAGKEGSDVYNNLTKELADSSDKLSGLEQGLSRVQKEFALSGGQLRGFVDILSDLSANIPTEAVMRAFGVRSGQGITVLLQNIDKLKKKDIMLKKIQAETATGKSIIDDMFDKIAQSLLHKWAKIKNAILASVSPIFTAFAAGMSPVLDEIQKIIKVFSSWIEKNKGMFNKIFKGIGKKLKKVLSDFLPEFTKILNKLSSTKKITSYTEYIYDKDKKEIISTKKELDKPIPEYEATIYSMGSLIRSGISSAILSLGPEINLMGVMVSEAIMTQLKIKMAEIVNILAPAFIDLGKALAKGLWIGLNERVFGKAPSNPNAPLVPVVDSATGKPFGSTAPTYPPMKATQKGLYNNKKSKEQVIKMANTLIMTTNALLGATGGMSQSVSKWQYATETLISKINELRSRTEKVENKVRLLSTR